MASGPPADRSPSPCDSEGSHASLSTGSGRKRDRTLAEEGDGNEIPAKRFTRGNTKNKPTLETIMAKLTDISTTQSRQSTLLRDLPVIRSTIATVCTDVAALKATSAELSTTTATLIGRTDQLTQDNAELRNTIATLEARVDQLSSAGNANALCYRRPSDVLTNELTISGLKFGTVSESVLLKLALAIAGSLKVDTLPGDFLGARLLRKPTATGTANQPTTSQMETGKCTFAVVCKNRSILTRILSVKRSFGALTFAQLDISVLPTSDPGLNQSGKAIISLNELLPSAVLTTLRDTKAQLKPAGFKFIWTRNGTVYVKYANDSPVQIVNSPADLPGILQLYSRNLPGTGQD